MGDRIPAEPELIAEMGVSGVTLLEAIKVLVRTKVFEVRRGGGPYVRATSESSGHSSDGGAEGFASSCFALWTIATRANLKALVTAVLLHSG